VKTTLRNPLVWVIAALVWVVPALYISTQQWVELRGTPKEMTWWESLAFQGPSWLLLVPLTPIVLAAVCAKPLQWSSPNRIALHGASSVVFGIVFLLIAVPTRLLVHDEPLRWSVFGEALYKSVPQFVIMGTAAYWAIAIVGSLLETRGRLYATLTVEPIDPEARSSTAEAPPTHVSLTTSNGTARLPVSEIAWIEAASTGAWLHTHADQVDDCVLVRHTLAQLEDMLGGLGVVRVHRSYMVNTAHVRAVTGSPTRDGEVRLTDGRVLPISRRRRQAMDAAVNGDATNAVRPS